MLTASELQADAAEITAPRIKPEPCEPGVNGSRWGRNSARSRGPEPSPATLASDSLHRSGYPALRSISCKQVGKALVLEGRVSTFYLKQVAQTLVRPYLQKGLSLLNLIDVHWEGHRTQG